MSTGTRFTVAAAVSSFVGVLIVTVSILVLGLLQGAVPEAPLLYAFAHVLFFVALFGWPVALGLMLVLGRPLLELLRNRVRLERPGALFMLASAIVGALLVLVVWSGFWGVSDQPLTWITVGLIAGGAAGAVFLRLAKDDGHARRQVQ